MSIAGVVLLTVTLVTPEGQPDVTQSHRMPSIEKCLESAREWMEQDYHALGLIGLAAGCQIVEPQGDDG